ASAEHTDTSIKRSYQSCRIDRHMTRVHIHPEMIPGYNRAYNRLLVGFLCSISFLGSHKETYNRAGLDDLIELVRNDFVMRQSIITQLPNGTDFVINDLNNVTVVPYEIFAARAIMLSSFPEKRVGA